MARSALFKRDYLSPDLWFSPTNLTRIEAYCRDHALRMGQPAYSVFDNLNPVVDTESCFDKLRVEPSHVSRRPSDTYYLDLDKVRE
jgi:phenylalanyl-tRNA synthetase alpha subunit